MIASTINLFCCHNEQGEVMDMFRQLQPYHPTRIVEEDNCLHSFFIAKDPCHIFYDAWVDSGIVQNKFIKTYKPKEIKVTSHAKFFNYDKLYEVANYIQMLTGFKVNIQEHDIEYKKHIAVDKKQIYKMYKNYIEEIQWDNI